MREDDHLYVGIREVTGYSLHKRVNQFTKRTVGSLIVNSAGRMFLPSYSVGDSPMSDRRPVTPYERDWLDRCIDAGMLQPEFVTTPYIPTTNKDVNVDGGVSAYKNGEGYYKVLDTVNVRLYRKVYRKGFAVGAIVYLDQQSIKKLKEGGVLATEIEQNKYGTNFRRGDFEWYGKTKEEPKVLVKANAMTMGEILDATSDSHSWYLAQERLETERWIREQRERIGRDRLLLHNVPPDEVLFRDRSVGRVTLSPLDLYIQQPVIISKTKKKNNLKIV